NEELALTLLQQKLAIVKGFAVLYPPKRTSHVHTGSSNNEAHTTFIKFDLFKTNQDISVTCLFVATKIEETYKKLKDILIEAYKVRHPEISDVNGDAQLQDHDLPKISATRDRIRVDIFGGKVVAHGEFSGEQRKSTLVQCFLV
ncbi:10297_t:CDS:2, partial [Acaulospora colombiana]